MFLQRKHKFLKVFFHDFVDLVFEQFPSGDSIIRLQTDSSNSRENFFSFLSPKLVLAYAEDILSDSRLKNLC